MLEVECIDKSTISLLKVASLKEDLHLVLTRDNGKIEVYHLDAMLREATLVFVHKESETITGLDIGFITSATKKEILFTCFSGAVKSLVDRKAAKKFGTNTEAAQTTEQAKKEKEQKLQELKKQVFDLQTKAETEQKKIEAPPPEPKQSVFSLSKTPRA